VGHLIEALSDRGEGVTDMKTVPQRIEELRPAKAPRVEDVD
jgi:hypothetical protein